MNREVAAEMFDSLRARLAAVEDPAVAELLEAMQTTIEELRVAEEELTRQNEELAVLQLSLADEARRYRGLFELAPVAFVTTNRDTTILEANDAAAELLGVSRRFLIGKPLPLYLDEPARRELRSRVLRSSSADEDGAARSQNARMRRRSGVAFEARVTTRAIADQIHWILQDVTEDRHAEQRLWELNEELETRVAARASELVTVLEQLPVGVLIVEPETLVIRSANRRAQDVLGSTVAAGRTIGSEQLGRFDANGRSIDRASWPVARAAKGETVEREVITLIDGDDRTVVLEISATAARAPDGRVTAAVVTFDDVTAREARERAEREFVTNAAHELRTPLTAIATAVEVLQSGAKEIPEERDLFLGHLERECRRLARLGTALLALARAQAQEEAPRTEVVALHEMLGEVGRELTVADTVEIRVDCARDVGTVSNRGLLDQAIWNLAANAAHHTIHGEIVLSGRLDGGRAIIQVRDSGPGIAPAARTRLFDRFYRGAEPRDGSGFGLGLSIAHESIRAVGGTLTVESDDGAGTVATISLPSARLL